MFLIDFEKWGFRGYGKCTEENQIGGFIIPVLVV